MCKTCQKILITDSYNSDWKKANLEWKCNKHIIEEGYCICGVAIKKQFLVVNTITKKQAWVGSTCINTIFFDNGDVIDYVNYYTCRYCIRKILRSGKTTHRKSNIHIKNVAESKNYRKCKNCKKWNIDINSPYWMIKCKPCHTGKHKCLNCNKYVKIQYETCYTCK